MFSTKNEKGRKEGRGDLVGLQRLDDLENSRSHHNKEQKTN